MWPLFSVSIAKAELRVIPISHLAQSSASSLALLPPSWLLRCIQHTATRVTFRKSRECAHTYTHAHVHTHFWLKPSRSFPVQSEQTSACPSCLTDSAHSALPWWPSFGLQNRSRLLLAWGFHTVGTLLPQVCGRFIIQDSPRCYSFRIEAVPHSFAV